MGDVGIDLVAQEKATGESCGIQCKFFLPETTLGKGEIDSFFTARHLPTLDTLPSPFPVPPRGNLRKPRSQRAQRTKAWVTKQKSINSPTGAKFLSTR